MSSNPYDPKTQPVEWQNWLNERIAEHDEANRERDQKIDEDIRHQGENQ